MEDFNSKLNDVAEPLKPESATPQNTAAVGENSPADLSLRHSSQPGADFDKPGDTHTDTAFFLEQSPIPQEQPISEQTAGEIPENEPITEQTAEEITENEPISEQTAEETPDKESITEQTAENIPVVGEKTETPAETEELSEEEKAEQAAFKKQVEEVIGEDFSPEQVIAKLEAEAAKENKEDTAPENLPIDVAVNVDDSQELADEVGVSGLYDAYGREIIEPVFENLLRMSKNSVKLAYSKLKNAILGYKGAKQKFLKTAESFSLQNKTLFLMEIGPNWIYLYLACDPDSLDKEVYSQVAAKGAQYKDTPSRITVAKDEERVKDAPSSLERALTLIAQVAKDAGAVALKTYTPTAYSQRYPLNPTAVLRGKENEEPAQGLYDSEEYDPIADEISRDIIAELMGPDHDIESKKGKERLQAMRQQAETIKGAVALTEPVVYFYDCAVNNDNTPAFIYVHQVLNDKFMGKILPQQYFAVAESSERITELNLMALAQVTADCNESPKMPFAVKVSCRLLSNKTSLQKLLKASATENKNLILVFDCALLEVLGQTGLDAVNILKQNDIKIMLSGTENAGLKVLTEYPISYLRLDGRYYKEENKATVAHLDMLTGYAKIQGITTVCSGIEHTKTARFFQAHGTDQVQGPVVCEPKRVVYAAVKGLKKLPTAK